MFCVGDIIVPTKEAMNKVHVRKARVLNVFDEGRRFDFELIESIYENAHKVYKGILTTEYRVLRRAKREFDV